ncbi:hypothetical protein AURDEDRAFT_126029 [Auricularia subglabra TFB-10046 SS5]|nr:hypothetical protein AURDEDRAFT_126029 [Auricularia subglabra TFB-10046 SS5]
MPTDEPCDVVTETNDSAPGALIVGDPVRPDRDGTLDSPEQPATKETRKKWRKREFLEREAARRARLETERRTREKERQRHAEIKAQRAAALKTRTRMWRDYNGDAYEVSDDDNIDDLD